MRSDKDADTRRSHGSGWLTVERIRLNDAGSNEMMAPIPMQVQFVTSFSRLHTNRSWFAVAWKAGNCIHLPLRDCSESQREHRKWEGEHIETWRHRDIERERDRERESELVAR